MLKDSKLGLQVFDSKRILLSMNVHANEAAERDLPVIGHLTTERAAIAKWFKQETRTLALRCLEKMRRENRIDDMKYVMRKAEHFAHVGEKELNKFWKEQAEVEGLYSGRQIEQSENSSESTV
jgi:hypothetical protein